ncbi:MAG: polyamine aminopropyltransferase [Methylococcales bacterium]
MKTYIETLYDAYGQEFRVDKLYFEARTGHQHLVIFHNAQFGRVMALDGVIQTTERDEFIYHEMLTHVPAYAHGRVRDVLIIGGGDGGILREILKHKSISKVIQVEIDATVIETCRKYLPGHSDGAFDDPRAEIVIDDGFNYVRQSDRKFDLIISDGTDPIGPGEVLFTGDYYSACKRCLNPGGVLVTQNGVAFMQPDELSTTARRLRELFADRYFYSAAVPTYVGGIMVFAWATDEVSLRRLSTEEVAKRVESDLIKMRYYNPAIHTAAFVLPQYVIDSIGDPR